MYPILFEFGPITVFSLWLMVAVGFVLGTLVFTNAAKRFRIKLDLVMDRSLALFLITLAASRLFFIIFHPEFYFYHLTPGRLLNFLAIWDKGLSFWGAVAGFTAGILYYSRKSNESPARLFDLLMPSLFIAMFFGEIGALLDGINYGTPTELPWGLTFRNANVKYITAIHPTQLYSAAVLILLALGSSFLLRRLRGDLPGLISELSIFGFSLFRFFEEFLRGDEAIKIIGIRLPQIIALIMIGISVKWLFARYTNSNGGDPEHRLKKFLDLPFLQKLRKRTTEGIREQFGALQNPAA